MKKYMAALAAGVTLVAGCKDSPIVNPNNAPTSSQLTGALTRPGLQTLVTGILVQDRAPYSGAGAQYLIISNIFARTAYRIDASEPRYVNETLAGQPDPGGFAGGGGGWNAFYTGIRAANVTVDAVNNAPAGVLTPAEKSATLGFIRTFKALDYYRILELRDTVGIALQDPNASSVTPAPLICKETALNYVAALLDSANADLTAAGASTVVPFSLPSGLTSNGRDYRKVSSLILFNRGLKGKIDVYRGLDHSKPNPSAFTAAIAEITTALGGKGPGAVDPSTFTYGAYHVFVPSGTEATPNALPDAKLGLNPLVASQIMPGDTRVSKIVPRSTIKDAATGISTNTTYIGAVSTNSANLSAPIGILRDEELVLLRAQAYIGAGQIANAVADINSVRAFYKAPLSTATTASQAITDVLYDKEYSLLLEGPQRLVDLRAYSRLNANFFPKATANDPFNTAFPIPKAEADARNGDLSLTCS